MQEETYSDINQILTDIVNRIRALESKYNILGERLLVVNQNMILQFKKNSIDSKTINAEIKELQEEIFNTKETMVDLTKEMQFFATKEDTKVLEKYINLWNPMKFITEKELQIALEKKDGKRNKRR